MLKLSRGSIDINQQPSLPSHSRVKTASKVIKFHKESEEDEDVVQMISPLGSMTNLEIVTSATKQLQEPKTDVQLRRKLNVGVKK